MDDTKGSYRLTVRPIRKRPPSPKTFFSKVWRIFNFKLGVQNFSIKAVCVLKCQIASTAQLLNIAWNIGVMILMMVSGLLDLQKSQELRMLSTLNCQV